MRRTCNVFCYYKNKYNSQTPWKGSVVHSLRTTVIISIHLADASVNYLGVDGCRLRLDVGCDWLDPSPGTSRLVLTSFSCDSRSSRGQAETDCLRTCLTTLVKVSHMTKPKGKGPKIYSTPLVRRTAKSRQRARIQGMVKNGGQWCNLDTCHEWKQSDPLQATAAARENDGAWTRVPLQREVKSS